MSFDLGQALGGAVKQYNEMTDQEMVNRKLKIEEAKAKRDADEAVRQDEKRAAIGVLGEIAHQPVGGYASSTSIEQLQKQYPDQPVAQDGKLTQFGTALANSIQNGNGVAFKPSDKSLIEQISQFSQSSSQPQPGIADPSQPAPSNPFAGMKVQGSRMVSANFNPDATQSVDDRKMWLQDYKKALVNVAKFSDNAEDILKVDKMVRSKEFDQNSNHFWDVKRAMAIGDDKAALAPLNDLMSSIMPGTKVGGLVRDKNGQLAGVRDANGKDIPVNMNELTSLFATDDPMKIIEIGFKNREVGAKEVAAGAEATKAGAYMLDANTKANESPSRIANNTAQTDSLIDDRKAKRDKADADSYEKQKVFSMGIKDPSAMSKSEKDRYGMISPIADTLWQTSRDSGLKMTGSQAVDIAEGLSGRVDKKTKAIDPSTIKYGAFVDDKTPDGMVTIKDIKSGQVKGYLPKPPSQSQAPTNTGTESSSPTPGIRAPTAAVDNQKFLRSKNNRGGYDYVPSPRGLTKAQYAEADAQRTK